MSATAHSHSSCGTTAGDAASACACGGTEGAREGATADTRTAPHEDEESDGWLWAARNGALKRAIHQQIGLDVVTVTWMEADPPSDATPAQDAAGAQRTKQADDQKEARVDEEAREWIARGWTLRPLFAERSNSMGLEVFPDDGLWLQLQQQVGGHVRGSAAVDALLPTAHAIRGRSHYRPASCLACYRQLSLPR